VAHVLRVLGFVVILVAMIDKNLCGGRKRQDTPAACFRAKAGIALPRRNTMSRITKIHIIHRAGAAD
jgi:hypothetical protein